MFSIEFRDLVEGERVLFETDSATDYAWTLFTLAVDPGRFVTVKADPLVVEDGPGHFKVRRPAEPAVS